jgi:polyphosphate kinase
MIFNRDISWLGFNERVLREASMEDVPLMERIKFLAIFSSNLDEFFRVRFPAVTTLSSLSSKLRKRTIPPTNKYLVRQVKTMVDSQLQSLGTILHEQLLPQLNENGIVLYYNQPLREEHRSAVKEIFLTHILSFIQPIYINKDFTANFIPVNDQPYFIVSIHNDEKKILKQVVVNIPTEQLTRFYTLPKLDNKRYIIFIDDIIRENMDYLFPGYSITAISSFKISRDAEIVFEEVFMKDIVEEIEKKIEKRKSGKPSRLLIEKDMPPSIQFYLKSLFKVKAEEIFEGGRYHNLKDMMSLPVKDPEFFYAEQVPIPYLRINQYNELFDLVRQQDRMLHFPYHNYNPVLCFFNHAAIDPEVRSIQVTLYRIAPESHIANALISAARNGKKVVVFMELKARFDEANNIKWTKLMKEAGVHIINNIQNLKVHSKIALVQKDNSAYAIIGTGNFNEKTARLYTDHAFMTSDPDITDDLRQLFYCLQQKDCKDQIRSLKPKKLLISQVNMLEELENEIRVQVANAKKGRPALIRLKMNNLEDYGIIQLLYKASRAGVKINLLVRGICCLVPGKKNSENIDVKRIVDRYLEHSRIFIFGEGDSKRTYIGSADLMTRNLFYRIEVAVPVMDTGLQHEMEDYFELQWGDNVKAVTLDKDQGQHFMEPVDGTKRQVAQVAIYDYLKQKIV